MTHLRLVHIKGFGVDCLAWEVLASPQDPGKIREIWQVVTIGLTVVGTAIAGAVFVTSQVCGVEKRLADRIVILQEQNKDIIQRLTRLETLLQGVGVE